MRRTFWMAVSCAMAIGLAAAMSGCSTSSANGNFTYNTSSAASSVTRTNGERTGGDSKFATWTFTDGNLAAAIAQTDAGAVQYTLNVQATCAEASGDFGFQLCTIAVGSTCTAGVVACPGDALPTVGDTFFLKTVEGVALFALVNGELHAGVVQGSCDASIAGDYLFSHLGVGTSDIFGLFRLDAALTSVVHADFGMRAITTTPFSREVYYATGNGGSGAETLTSSCTNGVWSIDTGGPDGTIKATLTASGLFLLNKASGGGILSFKTSMAAALADMSGKTMQGISFPDNDDPQPIKVVFGTATSTTVPATASIGAISGTTLSVEETQSTVFTKASAQSDADMALSPVPADGAGPIAYSANDGLDEDFMTIGDIPGLYYLPPFSPSDTGAVVISVAKLNGKLVAFGTVFNNREGSGGPVATDSLPNTGAFIAFEP